MAISSSKAPCWPNTQQPSRHKKQEEPQPLSSSVHEPPTRPSPGLENSTATCLLRVVHSRHQIGSDQPPGLAASHETRAVPDSPVWVTHSRDCVGVGACATGTTTTSSTNRTLRTKQASIRPPTALVAQSVLLFTDDISLLPYRGLQRRPCSRGRAGESWCGHDWSARHQDIGQDIQGHHRQPSRLLAGIPFDVGSVRSAACEGS